MTPAKKFFPNKISLESYDISDLRSDDSTDEDDAPKKKVPTWALGRTNSLKKKCFSRFNPYKCNLWGGHNERIAAMTNCNYLIYGSLKFFLKTFFV